MCFESDAGKCRLSPVPDGWKTAESQDLERMLRCASPVGKAPRGIFSDGVSFRRDEGSEGLAG